MTATVTTTASIGEPLFLGDISTGYGISGDTITLTNICSRCNTFGCYGWCQTNAYPYLHFTSPDRAELLDDGMVMIGGRKFQWTGKHWKVVL